MKLIGISGTSVLQGGEDVSDKSNDAVEKIRQVLAGDYTERDMLLAQAEYCELSAEREAVLGEDPDMEAELRAEAAVLRRQAALN